MVHALLAASGRRLRSFVSAIRVPISKRLGTISAGRPGFESVGLRRFTCRALSVCEASTPSLCVRLCGGEGLA
jgi:hypothetical protein